MGSSLTMADIPVAIQIYRYLSLVDDRPSPRTWRVGSHELRSPGLQEHVGDIP